MVRPPCFFNQRASHLGFLGLMTTTPWTQAVRWLGCRFFVEVSPLYIHHPLPWFRPGNTAKSKVTTFRGFLAGQSARSIGKFGCWLFVHHQGFLIRNPQFEPIFIGASNGLSYSKPTRHRIQRCKSQIFDLFNNNPEDFLDFCGMQPVETTNLR